MAAAWAKIPSAWAKIPTVEHGDENAGAATDPPEPASSGLRAITWRTHKTTGAAAIMVLLGLSILLNQRHRDRSLPRSNQILATYTELEEITELSRLLISRSLRLLEEVGAIQTTKVGNACSYTLVGLDKDGGWCAAPQQHLLDGSSYLKRMRGIREMIRRPATLFAMKLYMLLLTFRDRRSNTTRISYDAIAKYTGMRREDISLGWQQLAACRLAYLADDTEVPLKAGERKHNRYKINGLTAQG